MAKKSKKKKFTTDIIETKLPRSTWGYCHSNGLIEIDPRQDEEDFLNTSTHELLHRQFPWLSEEAVEDNATMIADSLWKLGYRRIKQ